MEKSVLREIWNSMFFDCPFTLYNDDIEIQGILLLLEATLLKFKNLSSKWSTIKSSHDEISQELKSKIKECSELKDQLKSLKGGCKKCTTLEKQLSKERCKASEALGRMNSIAKILKLDGLGAGLSEGKNSAMDIVSQMLLANSPKRKKICLEDETLVPETVEFEIEIPRDKQEQKTSVVCERPTDRSPKTNYDKIESKSLPIMTTSKKIVKKNLSANFDMKNSDDEDIIEESPKKPLAFNMTQTFDNSLLEYVKENNSELEKIWFDEDPVQEVSVVEETPVLQDKPKSRSAWLLKEKNGVGKEKTIRGNRLKQLKLGLIPKKENILDISKHMSDENDIIAVSPNSVPSSSLDLISSSERNKLDATFFKPLASSTQRTVLTTEKSNINERLDNKKSTGPGFLYLGDPVRKKAERKKLQGWECDECEKYYAALGDQMSPSKIKERMDTCSRHRQKYNPVHGTPPEFWNPLFPDSEYCKEQKLCESFRTLPKD